MTPSIAIVTGAAGGIGRACAERLAKAGYAVIAADLSGPPPSAKVLLNTKTNMINDLGLDVADGRAIESLSALVESLGLSIEVLVNAAGVFQDITPLAEFAMQEHDRIWDVNYHGTYRMCRAFGLLMAKRKGGAIINISSINAMRSTPLLAYAPAKAAINSLTACLASELGTSGVRVNAICPGFTLTPALATKIATGLRDEAAILSSTALGHWVLPDDVAVAVQFLASKEARSITGISLPVDAGWLAAESWKTFGGVRELSRP